MKKRLFVGMLCALLVLAMLPLAAMASTETVENIRTFSFIGGETTQEQIDAAFGEGAVLYTSEEVNGETVYTIKLLKNITMAAGCDVRIGEYRADGPALPQMILDLNGCTILSQSIGLINYGDLIIRDTSQAQTGTIKYSTTSDKSSLVAISHKGGHLQIEGGTFICEAGYAFTGYVAAVSTQAGATSMITGGTFISNSSAVLSTGETTIMGGTFTAPYGLYAKSQDGVPGTILVPEDSTAEITASSFAMVIQRVGTTDGQITALGGSYDAPNVVGGVSKPDTQTAVAIGGGTYTADPSAYVDEAAVMRLERQGVSSYAVGEEAVASTAASAAAGDTLEVLSGDVALNGIADGVIVSNKGGNVTVNGDEVLEDAPLTVCNHTWGAPVWAWKADGSAATATFTCTKDASHTRALEAVAEKKTTPATCTADGSEISTVSVTLNGKAYTDSKTATLQATGHNYVDGVCTVCGEAQENPDIPATGDVGQTVAWVVGALSLCGIGLMRRKKAQAAR